MWVWGSTSHLPINGVPEMSRGFQLEEDLVQEQDRASTTAPTAAPGGPDARSTSARRRDQTPHAAVLTLALGRGCADLECTRKPGLPRARSGPQDRP